MNTLETISKRSSCRAFRAEQINNSELEKILQAGNAAPVGMAKYETLKISVIQNKTLIDSIDAKGAAFFAKQGIDMPHPLHQAPTFIIVSGTKDPITSMNAACVIENMIIEATDIGIGSCYIMGNVAAIKGNKEIETAVTLPEGFDFVSGLILGYPAAEPVARKLVTDKIATDYIK